VQGPEAMNELIRRRKLVPGAMEALKLIMQLGAGALAPRAIVGLRGTTEIDIAPGKFNYLFGKVASSSHNAARSNQLALEMKRLGVPDSTAGHQMLTEHFAAAAHAEGNVLRTFSNQYGTFEVRDSLFIGPSGKAVRFETTFQVLAGGRRQFSTTITLRGGN